MDFTLWHYIVIALLGVVASVINILAGGGSNLILPTLMMFGVPPDIANGSNRVGVMLQAVSGMYGFHRAKKLPMRDFKGIIGPMLLGSLLGSVLASVLPNEVLKPALLLTMLGCAALIFFKPNLLMVQENEEVRCVRDVPAVRWLLLGVGIYGGFVQAGVGFLMLPIFAGVLRYDLIRSNALKIACTCAFTGIALVVFILQNKVWWLMALSLSVGNIIGAQIGVRTALKLSPKAMRWILLIMTLVAVIGALLK